MSDEQNDQRLISTSHASDLDEVYCTEAMDPESMVGNDPTGINELLKSNAQMFAVEVDALAQGIVCSTIFY